jgi:DNA-directed RNA polymerase specialized sigma24 family protein
LRSPRTLAAHPTVLGRAERDPLEELAIVASSKRELLLRAHAFRLRREDLEDCYAQATVEMVQRVRRSGAFADRRHILNALEQRFVSRIHDRRRALGGRSPMTAALEGAARLSGVAGVGVDPIDQGADPEQIVAGREDLRRVLELAPRLSDDQRLVLATQIALQMSPAEFCERFGWSVDKYRKVAQRARRRLRWLMCAEEVAAEERAASHPGDVVGGDRGTRS